jgi:hypothetical protein
MRFYSLSKSKTLTETSGLAARPFRMFELVLPNEPVGRAVNVTSDRKIDG